jgi:hypothetical protein
LAALICAETLTLSVPASRRAFAPRPDNRTRTLLLSPTGTENLTTPKRLLSDAVRLRVGAASTRPLAVQAVPPIGQLTVRPVSTTIERLDLIAFGLPVTDALACPGAGIGAGQSVGSAATCLTSAAVRVPS